MTRALPTPADLPPNAQRRLEQLADPELRALVAAAYPSAEAEREAQSDLERRQRQAIRDELAALKTLADAVEAGQYGPEGKELARRLLQNGRTDANLRELRTALRRLR